MRRLGAAFAAVLAAAVSGCNREEPYVPPQPRASVAPQLPGVQFAERTREAGIDFVHVSGAAGKKWMPETMGGGAGVIDYNRDGRPDLVFVSGSFWPDDPRRAEQRSSIVLYENTGTAADGTPSFRDVTRAAGLERVLYGMGAAVGDVDNDGWEDLLVTALGGSVLFRNNAGRFTDTTRAAGLSAPGWDTSAAFLDYDRDGWLDLFVCRYVDWTPEKDVFCTLDGSTKAYCTPERYDGVPSRLWRNRGDGTFEDVTERAGVGTANAKALGVAACDMDMDGDPDIAVANDTAPNNLYRNEGNGTFTDVAIEAGIAVGETGRARGAMGIAWGDAKNGEGLTLAIGNFANELKSVYTTRDGRTFFDESPMSGVGPTSLLSLTFGVLWLDYDLDGRLDLLLANGHVEPTVQEVQHNVAYRQAPVLYWNAGGGRFAPVGAAAGADLVKPLVARGALTADFDGDTDLDLVVVENGGPAHLYVNGAVGTQGKHRAVRVRLEGDGRVSRDGVGARVTARAGKLVQRCEVSGGHGYLVAPEKTLTFGLGKATQLDSLEVVWPDGAVTRRAAVAPGALVTLRRADAEAPGNGKGRAAALPSPRSESAAVPYLPPRYARCVSAAALTWPLTTAGSYRAKSAPQRRHTRQGRVAGGVKRVGLAPRARGGQRPSPFR